MLHSLRLGIAGGLIWSVSLFVLTFVWMNTDYAPMFQDFMMQVYPGYEISVKGAFIGSIWGFLDSFIGFYLLAWIYNKLGGNE